MPEPPRNSLVFNRFPNYYHPILYSTYLAPFNILQLCGWFSNSVGVNVTKLKVFTTVVQMGLSFTKKKFQSTQYWTFLFFSEGWFATYLRKFKTSTWTTSNLKHLPFIHLVSLQANLHSRLQHFPCQFFLLFLFPKLSLRTSCHFSVQSTSLTDILFLLSQSSLLKKSIRLPFPVSFLPFTSLATPALCFQLSPLLWNHRDQSHKRPEHVVCEIHGILTYLLQSLFYWIYTTFNIVLHWLIL